MPGKGGRGRARKGRRSRGRGRGTGSRGHAFRAGEGRRGRSSAPRTVHENSASKYIESISLDSTTRSSRYDRHLFGVAKEAIVNMIKSTGMVVVMDPENYPVDEDMTETDARKAMADDIRASGKTSSPMLLNLDDNGNKMEKYLMPEYCNVTKLLYTDDKWPEKATEQNTLLVNLVQMAQTNLDSHKNAENKDGETYAADMTKFENELSIAQRHVVRWTALRKHIADYKAALKYYERANPVAENQITKAMTYIKLQADEFVTPESWNYLPQWKRYFLYKAANNKLYKTLSGFVGQNVGKHTVFLTCDIGDGKTLWDNICEDALAATTNNAAHLLSDFIDIKMELFETYKQYHKRVLDKAAEYKKTAGKPLDFDLITLALSKEEKLPKRYHQELEHIRHDDAKSGAKPPTTTEESLERCKTYLTYMDAIDKQPKVMKAIEQAQEGISSTRRRRRRGERANAAGEGKSQTCGWCKKHFPERWTTHKESECRTKAEFLANKGGSDKDADIICYNCGQKGHKERDCPDLDNKKQLESAHKPKRRGAARHTKETAAAAISDILKDMEERERHRVIKALAEVRRKERDRVKSSR